MPPISENFGPLSALAPVSAAESGQKLLQFLQRRLDLPPAMLHRWIRTGQVRCNGKRCKAFTRVEEGDMVRLPPFAQEMRDSAKAAPCAAQPCVQNRRPSHVGADTALPPQPPLPALVHASPQLLVFNKPAGLPVHPGTGHTDSLTTRLSAHYPDAPFCPTPAHRLDKDTSGLLLVACAYSSLRMLQEALISHNLVKEYLAWVDGAWPLLRDGAQPLLPDGAQPLLPDGAQPLLPDGAQPFLPDGAQPLLPDGAQPILPDGAQPILPDGTRPILVDETPDPACPDPPQLLRDHLAKSYTGSHEKVEVVPAHDTTHADKDQPAAPLAACLVRCLRREEGRSLMHIRLLTGKTHQIRVQLASRGHPLCGDVKYGSQRRPPFKLHAMRLILPNGSTFEVLPPWRSLGWSVTELPAAMGIPVPVPTHKI